MNLIGILEKEEIARVTKGKTMPAFDPGDTVRVGNGEQSSAILADLEKEMPEVFRQLHTITKKLEKHYRDIQDFEFTIEKGKLYCLQTRNGKMNARAMVRSSVEMFNEGLITKERALLRIEPAMLEQLLVPQLSPNFRGKSLAQGLPASPGAACWSCART